MMSTLDQKDVDAIAQADTTTLARWWCLLNKFEWPSDGLGQPEAREYKPGDRRGQIMEEIMNRIGLMECLRAWNAKSMPGEAFDQWWSSHRPLMPQDHDRQNQEDGAPSQGPGPRQECRLTASSTGAVGVRLNWRLGGTAEKPPQP